MTRADLIKKVAERTGLDHKKAERAVATTFDTIRQALADGDKVQILGFGTFENRTRAPRKGRNPRTGEEIEIKASNLPSFKAGKTLKEAVNG